VQVNRRWLVNLVALFAGIHFYTQWFERLGATPSRRGGDVGERLRALDV
jgi:iron complex transport system permease protein